MEDDDGEEEAPDAPEAGGVNGGGGEEEAAAVVRVGKNKEPASRSLLQSAKGERQRRHRRIGPNDVTAVACFVRYQ